MNFEQQYKMAGELNKRKIIAMTVARVMDVQRRAKIKPSAFNPVLLNSPGMRGGNALSPSSKPLDLYYPSQ